MHIFVYIHTSMPILRLDLSPQVEVYFTSTLLQWKLNVSARKPSPSSGVDAGLPMARSLVVCMIGLIGAPLFIMVDHTVAKYSLRLMVEAL